MSEIKGSYRGWIYIAIYRRDPLGICWSASLEDEDGAVIFIAGYFLCDEGADECETELRHKIFGDIDAHSGYGIAAVH
ncbi:hypothetical protein [Dyella choica]|uniref:Uncharacterized protein n=1 Tax=Dyella choica TaxID=1927959 RepID=A0A432M4K8_9GAMM|nr:hypothetical protein [Dyella choica]RUL74460.1 hypothetical protein EKH80_13320 [Dyella choica]